MINEDDDRDRLPVLCDPCLAIGKRSQSICWSGQWGHMCLTHSEVQLYEDNVQR